MHTRSHELYANTIEGGDKNKIGDNESQASNINEVAQENLNLLSETQISRKREKILRAINSNDITKLKILACSRGGLIDNQHRKFAWPMLLGMDINNIPERPDKISDERSKKQSDYKSLVNDTNLLRRIFTETTYPISEELASSIESHSTNLLEHRTVVNDLKRTKIIFTTNIPEKRLLILTQLYIDTMCLLFENPEINYYQGLHDIMAVVLTVAEEKWNHAVLKRLIQSHLKNYVEPTMDKVQSISYYVCVLIGKSNAQLSDFLVRCFETATSLWCRWFTTWFAHDLNNIDDILILFDFFIASDPFMPVYFAAIVILYQYREILQCQCDMITIYKLLRTIPDSLPLHLLIKRAENLFAKFPPSTIANEANLLYEQINKMQPGSTAKQRINKMQPGSTAKQKSAKNASILASIKDSLSSYLKNY